MAMNPMRLRPSDAVRLINSTPIGPILNDRQLRRHRERAGFRVTDDEGQTINIFKYASWLTDVWLEREANPRFVDFDAVETLSSSCTKALLIYSDNDIGCSASADTYKRVTFSVGIKLKFKPFA